MKAKGAGKDHSLSESECEAVAISWKQYNVNFCQFQFLKQQMQHSYYFKRYLHFHSMYVSDTSFTSCLNEALMEEKHVKLLIKYLRKK